MKHNPSKEERDRLHHLQFEKQQLTPAERLTPAELAADRAD